MIGLAEALAKKFYEIHEQVILFNMTYSKTSLIPKKWEDLSARARLSYVEAFKKLLSDEEIVRVFTNRAGGL